MTTSTTSDTFAPPPTLTFEEALDAARALAERIRDEAPETERRTRHSQGLHEQFLAAGFYHLLRPRMFGGYEFTVKEFLQVMREIARADMATAWCLTLAAGHNLQVASFWPEQAQRELFAGPYFAAPMTSAPSGTLTRVEGGFLVDGVHRYASGVPYSTHFSGHATHLDRPGVVSTFIAPRDTYTVLDDWGKTLGLKGSGSNSVKFEKAFIPEHYVLEGVSQIAIDLSNGTPGLCLHGNSMYGGTTIGFFGVELTSLAIGAALASFDEYEEAMPTRRTTLPPFPTRAEDPYFQRRYGLARARLEAAVGTIDRALDLQRSYTDRVGTGGAPMTLEEDLHVLLVSAEAGNLAWSAVQDFTFKSMGSSAVVNGSRAERIWRDLSQWWTHVNTQMDDPVAGQYTRTHFAPALEAGKEAGR